jgi:hypothetical protein
MIDPNEQTIDGRSAAMERNVQTARQPVKDPIEGFLYRASFRNAAAAKIDLIFWEYRFAEPADRSNFSRRQFLCVARIKPGDRGDVEAFSIFGPTDTIAAGTAGKAEGRFIEDVVINRIEFSNGAVLQRSDWDYQASKDAIDRITKTPWAGETCRLF